MLVFGATSVPCALLAGRLFQCGSNTSAENSAQPANTMNTVTPSK